MASLPATTALTQSQEYQLTSTTGTTEFYPRAAQDSDGNFHLSYYINDANVYALWYRKVSPTGELLAGPLRLSPTNITGSLANSAIAVDQADRVHVTFAAQFSSDSSADIFYAQLSKAGAITVPGKRVFASAAASTNPDIDADAAGYAYITWQEGTAIHWIKLTSTGAVSLTARSISGTLGVGGAVTQPRIGVAANGTSYVVWQHKQNQLSRVGVWFSLLDSAGVAVVKPKSVYSSNLMDVSQLAADLDESAPALHMTFVQGLSGSYDTDVRHLQVSPGGTASASVQVVATTIGQVSLPDISEASNGDAYVTYIMRDNPINGVWHTYLWVRWESNQTAASPVVVGKANLTAIQPSVAAGRKDPGVFFERTNDLFLVMFQSLAPPTNHPPVAVLHATPSNAQVGQSVSFDGSASSDPDSGDRVTQWNFQWGDGAGTGWVTSSTATHSYSVAGTYTATLTVKDTHDAQSAAATATVKVTGGGTTNQPPVARLTAIPTSVKVGANVLFDGSSSSDPDGSVAQYLFNFGDGESLGWTAQGQTTHAYASAGVFNATLQVKDDKGKPSENTATAPIAVEAANQPPVATIVSIVPNPATQGDTVTLTGTGTDPDGAVVAYSWESNFDGPLSDQATFMTSTLSVGVHTITFKVRDDDGAWSDPATATLEVQRNAPPTLSVLTNRTKGDTETVVEFLVRYIDAENDAPTSARLFYGIGGEYSQEPLIPVDATDTNYRDGKDYYFKTKLGKAGTYKYYFEFQNAKNGKQISTVGTIVITQAKGPLPAAGAPAAALAMLLAAFALAVALRGSKRARDGNAGPVRDPSKSVR